MLKDDAWRLKVPEDYVYIAETDHILLRDLPNRATPQLNVAFFFPYMSPVPEQQARVRAPPSHQVFVLHRPLTTTTACGAPMPPCLHAGGETVLFGQPSRRTACRPLTCHHAYFFTQKADSNVA